MPALTKLSMALARYGPVTCSRSCLSPRLWRGVWLPCADLFWDHAEVLANEGQACFIGYGGMLMESSWRLWRWFPPVSSIRACILPEQPDGGAGSGRDGGCGRFCPQVVSSWGFSITPDTLNQIAAKWVNSRSFPVRAVRRRWRWDGLHSARRAGRHDGCGVLVYFAILFEALFILTAVDAGTRLRALCCRICWAWCLLA